MYFIDALIPYMTWLVIIGNVLLSRWEVATFFLVLYYLVIKKEN